MDFWISIGDMVNKVTPFLDNIPALRAILGSILVFFLPGFAWTLVFFRKVNYLERFVLSIGLSIALVILSILVCNLVLNISISGASSLIIILIVTAAGLAVYYTRRYLEKRKAAEPKEDNNLSAPSQQEQ